MTPLLYLYFSLHLGLNIVVGYLVKSWAVGNSTLIGALALVLNTFALIFMALQVRQLGLSSVGAYVLVLTVLGNVLIGVLLFGEKLAMLQALGVGLALLGVGLITLGGRA